jgi:hypothetical protein
MRRCRPVAVGMDVAVLMAVAVGVRRNHGKMLYYNITGVYEPNRSEWLREDDGQRGERRE